MKIKLLLFSLFLCSSLQFLGQEIPQIKVGKNTIAVKKLNITVVIIGDVAITTYDMQFYNPKNSVLEGELSFPLGENQSVTHFALNINGHLREAVVVEKEKARVAFESTVRNRIDPALLEQTKGNNYKARVYPIPAKGYKRVVVAFQQKLLVNEGSFFYKIPFNYKDKLEDFSLSIEVLNQKNKPVFKKGMVKEFLFDAVNDSYYAKINKTKFKVTEPVLIQIPLNINQERNIANKEVFYFSKKLNIKPKNIFLENEITIFWDNSLSQKNKKITTETDFLSAFFNKVKDCKVNFVLFNIGLVSKNEYSVKNGDWDSLKKQIENVVYDGASSYRFLKSYEDNSKLNLLFTDGLNTISNSDIKLNTKTHIINSAIAANHIFLQNGANTSGGKYINLQQVSVKTAIQEISASQLQFLGTNFSEEMLEVYPKKGSIVTNDFSIYGKGNYLNKTIEFYFGHGKDTIKTVFCTVNKYQDKIDFISKIWAQKKLNDLMINVKENKEEIIRFSKKHQIISPFTSMIILDRVEDYVTHNIEPPIELKEKYDELVAQKVNNKKGRILSLQQQLFVKYEDVFNWYNKDYVSKRLNESVLNESSTSERQSQITEIVQDSVLQNGDFFVSGVISDSSQPLPGVSVQVKGTTRGTLTDFDGKYKIKSKEGETLSFSYLGYKSMEKVIRNSNNLNLQLEEDGQTLDEIVVVAYGARRRSSITASVTAIKAESITNTVQGQAAGVAVNGHSNEASNELIRGVNAMKENTPLYVVDGKVVENYSAINPNKIQSLYTLNDSQSTSIYGSRASNGIVVIVTKKGFDDDLEEIQDFENLVKEKLELKGWNPDTPYLKILEKSINNEEAYTKYIELREKYNTSPSFYIDVADFFRSRKADKVAIQILTNVAEIELDNYELLKALAYKFEEYKLYDYAVYVFKEIVLLRPEDIQSHRDLALAYEHVGKYQESVDLLFKIVNAEFLEKDENRRFSGIEVIALNELNRVVHLYKKEIVISHIPEKYIINTQTDLRVLIDWNHNDTDIDLWVTDPNGEKCFYKHQKTKIGGLMSEDMTDGFGPEQFLLKKAIKGIYKIQIKYYANSQQKISGPTFLKLTTFKNYGYKNEIKKTQLVRLIKVDDVLGIGKLLF